MYLRLVPVLLVMGTIFYLSHQEGSKFSFAAFPYIDKLGHLLLYSILAGAALYALPPSLRQDRAWRSAAVVIVFCLAYGITDEVHQLFIPERNVSIFDLAADLTGAATIVLFWYRRQRQDSFRSIHLPLSVGNHPDKKSGVL